MSLKENRPEEKSAFQKEYEQAISIEDARMRPLKHIDELFFRQEGTQTPKINGKPATSQLEDEQVYTVEEAKSYVLNHLRSIWKK